MNCLFAKQKNGNSNIPCQVKFTATSIFSTFSITSLNFIIFDKLIRISPCTIIMLKTQNITCYKPLILFQ